MAKMCAVGVKICRANTERPAGGYSGQSDDTQGASCNVGWTIRRNHGELARAGRHRSSRSNSPSHSRQGKRGSRVWTVPEDGGYLTTHGFRLRSAADRSRGVRDQPEHRSLNAVCSEMIIDSEARQVDPVRFSEQDGLVVCFCEFGNIRGAGAARAP